MKACAIAAAGGFVLVVLFVPIVKKLCARWGLYDQPGPLKLHTRPIPRLGGVAIAIGVLGGLLLSLHLAAREELALFAAIVLICVVGAADDIRGISVVPRLAAQVIAGAILWYGGGRLPSLGAGAVSLIFSSGFTVAVINAFNFLDGCDGLATGVAGIAAIAFAALPWPATDRLSPAVSWVLAASCAGFLPFNFPPGRIFLGDCGSTLLGMSVAFLGLNFYRSPSATGPRLLLPLVLAALPLLDLALTVARRLRARTAPWSGDRQHFCDLILGRGWTPTGVALLSYGITALFGVIAVAGERTTSAEFLVLAGVGVGILLVVEIRLGALRPDIAEDGHAPKALTQTSH